MKARAIDTVTRLALATLLAALTPAATQAQALPGADAEPDYVPGRLIVLLQHGEEAPAPEDVVDAHRRGMTLPGNLAIGNPRSVEFGLSDHLRGKPGEALEADPKSPRARLERYLVFTYSDQAPLETLQTALEQNPHVELVEKDRLFRLFVSPNDPLFDDTPGDATLHQWGSLALNLPNAWDHAKGHAYVGLIDLGVDKDHPDLQAFDGMGNYVGGNFRPHLSWDFKNPSTCDPENPDCVDEKEEGGLSCFTDEDPDGNCAGHGTHVSGIVGSTADNGQGVAGACWHCSVLMTRGVSNSQAGNGLVWHADHGAQAISMSFGNAAGNCDPVASGYSFFCDSIATVEARDVVLTAAPGNDKVDIEFPAKDVRVMSIGGLEPSGAFWDRSDEGEGCPCEWSNPTKILTNNCSSASDTFECGSNYTVTPGSAQQDLVAPAKDVLSTFYVDEVWNRTLGCWDDPNHPTGAESGYDLCTGTSMASPYASALAGILRSVNPLLSKAEIRDALTSNASLGHLSSPDAKLGFGVPDTSASVQDVLGRVGGTVIDNRLTPLFQLEAFTADDHIYTTSPQMGSALTRGSAYDTASGDQDYWPQGPDVPGYGHFPGGNCLFVSCPAKASVYIFTGHRSPNGHPLVPLYRLSFDKAHGSNPENRDHNYTTEKAGIEAFEGEGYRLDGVEGYIYQRCSPEPSCIPDGATRLYRYYNSDRDDWAIFPESELSQWEADGYSAQSGANPWIGYVYENVDADGDALIDGFESLIGTDPNTADTDCDGANDGAEFLDDYPYGDPLDGTCSQIIGETGQVTDLTHGSHTEPLEGTYTNPVVIARPPSYNGAHESVVRITDVRADEFDFFIDEAPDQDGPHTLETVSYVVLEAGSWELPDGTEIEAGTVTTNASVGRNFAGSFDTVGFSQAFATAPSVLTQIQTNNDPAWAKTRQRLASTSSFKVALEEEEAATAAHGTETIGWLAVTPGTGVWSGHRFEAGNTADSVTDAFYSIGFTQSFASAPRFVAALATRDGGDNSALRYRNLGKTSVQVKVEEDTTNDSEVSHTTEVVSYLALQGDGKLAASPR